MHTNKNERLLRRHYFCLGSKQYPMVLTVFLRFLRAPVLRPASAFKITTHSQRENKKMGCMWQLAFVVPAIRLKSVPRGRAITSPPPDVLNVPRRAETMFVCCRRCVLNSYFVFLMQEGHFRTSVFLVRCFHYCQEKETVHNTCIR